jgi:hypothetical protein
VYGAVPATLRLAAFAAAVALITSRIGLVVHELVGHAAAANALGAGVDDVELYWFAGGWVRYDRDTLWSLGDVLVVQLGGITLQLAGGLAALAWGRRLRRRPRKSAVSAVIGTEAPASPSQGWLGVAVTGFGAGWLIHAAAYLAIGTWHGFGDGTTLHRVLGAWRPAVAIPAAALAIAATFLAARAVAGRLAATIPTASRGRQLALFAVALAIAGGLHAGAARAELAVRADATYGAIMKPARDRTIDRDFQAWLAEQRARGVDPDAALRDRERRRLERARPRSPFGAIVIAAIALAGLAGAVTSRRREPAALDRRALATAAAVAAAAIAVVIATGAVFPL